MLFFFACNRSSQQQTTKSNLLRMFLKLVLSDFRFVSFKFVHYRTVGECAKTNKEYKRYSCSIFVMSRDASLTSKLLLVSSLILLSSVICVPPMLYSRSFFFSTSSYFLEDNYFPSNWQIDIMAWRLYIFHIFFRPSSDGTKLLIIFNFNLCFY